MAGAACILPADSNVYVGQATAGTLDVPAGAQTVKSLTDRFSGTLNVSIGASLASLGNVTFNPGSTINISGTVAYPPQLLMTYLGSASGKFTNVFDNGSPLPAGDLTYSGGSVEVSTATSFIGAPGSGQPATGA